MPEQQREDQVQQAQKQGVGSGKDMGVHADPSISKSAHVPIVQHQTRHAKRSNQIAQSRKLRSQVGLLP